MAASACSADRRAGLASLFKKLRVVEGDADCGSDGDKEALICLREATFFVNGLNADDTDDLAAGRDWNAEVRGGAAADLFDAHRGALAINVLVDEERLAGANDLRCEPDAVGAGLRALAMGVGKFKHHGGAIEEADIGDGRVEELANFFADELDEAIFVELRDKGLRDAIDGDEPGCALADFVLLLIDLEIGVGIVQRDGGVGGEIFEQGEMLLCVCIFLEALNTLSTPSTRSAAMSGR